MTFVILRIFRLVGLIVFCLSSMQCVSRIYIWTLYAINNSFLRCMSINYRSQANALRAKGLILQYMVVAIKISLQSETGHLKEFPWLHFSYIVVVELIH